MLRLDNGRAVRLSPGGIRVVAALMNARKEVSAWDLAAEPDGTFRSKSPDIAIRVAVHRINEVVKAATGSALIECRFRAGYFISRNWNQGAYWLNEERWALSGVMQGAYRDLLY